MSSCQNLIVAASCLLAIASQFRSQQVRAQEISATREAGPFHSLLTKSFPGDMWSHYSGRKNATLGDTWRMEEDPETKSLILICTGEPHGYLKTRRTYENFELKLEWRFPKNPNGNSGVLLFVSGEDRVWPESLQIQFHQPEVGSTFPVGGARSTNEFHLDSKLSRPVNQWNQCELRCQDGTVTVIINGHTVGEVLGCRPSSGALALQSEGSEIHFRAISIREIPIAQNSNPPSAETSQDEIPSTLTIP